MYERPPKDPVAFEDGYNAGINDKPKAPAPNLALSLSSDGYLDNYTACYDQGYDRAQKDRALLLQGRDQEEEWYLQTESQLERSDV